MPTNKNNRKHRRNKPKASTTVKVKNKKLVASPPVLANKKSSVLCRFCHQFIKLRKILITTTLLLLLLLVLVIPKLQSTVLGVFIKKDVSLVLINDLTQEAVSGAEVTLAGKQATSDGSGHLFFKNVPIGKHDVNIVIPYFTPKKQSIYVPLFSSFKQQTIALTAHGSLAKVTVINRLNGVPIQGATIELARGSSARTGSDGTATVVLGGGVTESNAVIRGEKILATTTIVRAAQDALTNKIEVVPNGRIAYLSGASGKLDVMSSQLDGTDKKVLLNGTGYENSAETKLFLSPDLKFAALYAKRNPDMPTAQLYIVSLADGAIMQVEDEKSTIEPFGWQQERFVYKATPTNKAAFEVQEKLQYFDSLANKVTTIDTTQFEGTSAIDFAQEYIVAVYVTHQEITYSKAWRASYYYGARLADKIMTVQTLAAKDSQPLLLKSWPAGYYASLRMAWLAPKTFYIHVRLDGEQHSFWELKNGIVKLSEKISIEDVSSRNNKQIWYAPNGLLVSWSELINGSYTTFVSDNNGTSTAKVAEAMTFTVAGWHTNDYLLLQDKNELYIMGRNGIQDRRLPLKVTDSLLSL